MLNFLEHNAAVALGYMLGRFTLWVLGLIALDLYRTWLQFRGRRRLTA